MTDDNKTDCKLTAQARATIMDACQSISRNADELKNCHTVDGDWGDDLEAKAFYEAELRLLGRLTALLAAQQSEPQASAGVIAAAIAVIEADRAHLLTDDHIDALDIAIKIQRGMFKLPAPHAEATECGCATNEACKMKKDGSCWRAD
ncbi:hypothetical protein [Burkholderia sp. LMG 13014]|uniref:hypothetical protein n=1 Tax=Burkholderia sp. LMG 13014 TaxID=2709306 RepID=UPI00196645CF|nr:hypothetical protein [Burkholderia sp. LMG 13014]